MKENNKRRAIYAGSFDPFTNGHLDIVKRALKIFDEVTLLIAVSPLKKSLISKEKRQELLEKIFKDEKKIKVDTWDKLIVDYAKKEDITSIVRGLRPTGDFENEFQMASMNRKLNTNIETVFFMTGEKLYYVSSSLVKEVYKHDGNVEEFVPKEVNDYLKELSDEHE